MAFIGIKAMCTARGICRSFYPSLLPECRYLAHQDFLHFFHGWIHITTYLLRDSFEWAYEVPHSDMVVVWGNSRSATGLTQRGFWQCGVRQYGDTAGVTLLFQHGQAKQA